MYVMHVCMCIYLNGLRPHPPTPFFDGRKGLQVDLESRVGPRVIPEVVWRPCRGRKRLPEGSEGVPESSNGFQEAAQADPGEPRGSTYTYLHVFARVYVYLMGSKDVPVGVCLLNTVVGGCRPLSGVVGGCRPLSAVRGFIHPPYVETRAPGLLRRRRHRL